MTDKTKDVAKQPKHELPTRPLTTTSEALAAAISPSSSLGKSLQLYEANLASFAKVADLDRPLLQLAKSVQALDNFKFPSQQIITAMESIQSVYGIAETAQKSIQQLAIITPRLENFINFQSTFSSYSRIFDMVESYQSLINSMVDVGSFQSFTRLNDYTTLNLDLEDLSIEHRQVEATSLASTEISIGSLKLVSTEVVAVSARLDRVEAGQQELLSELYDIKQLIIEGKAKLIPARIQSCTVTKDRSKLIINNQEIGLDPNSMQAYLAQILFNNPKSARLRWHIEDIAQKFEGEAALDDIGRWNDKFYQAARNLNNKIGIILGTNTKAILHQRQEYWVNPELLSLINS